MLSKSLITNLVAIGLILIGLSGLAWSQHLYSMGVFAFSGAITNWIAVYMLFDKVPFIYGSGIIPLHFEDFKSGIRTMLMEQFFNRENIENFLKNEERNSGRLVNYTAILDEIDYNMMYDKLVNAIMSSSFGGMLGMFGGKEALTPLRTPFCERIRAGLEEMLASERFQSSFQKNVNNTGISNDLKVYIEQMIDNRLGELTPHMVKEIIQTMIREHLGWLVIWGGVFGGIIGLVSSFIRIQG